MPKVKQFETEAELAGAFMEHLGQLGWDCYPEVTVGSGSARADIVALQRPLLWIVEAKLCMNEAVCEQAMGWLRRAHFVSVLVPQGKRHRVLEAYCRDRGIGVITARRWTSYRQDGRKEIEFEQAEPAKLHRRGVDAKYMIDRLHPDMKNYAPGTSAGYSSPWKRTMNSAVDAIMRAPGLTMKEIVRAVNHHYASDQTARSCLVQWLREDKRVRTERDGRAIRFYPAEVSTQAKVA